MEGLKCKDFSLVSFEKCDSVRIPVNFLEETSKLTNSESCPKPSERVPLRRLQARSRSTNFQADPTNLVMYHTID